MKRKELIKLAAISGGYISSKSNAEAISHSGPPETGLTADILQQFLTSQLKLKPDTIVKKIATCWMSDWETCKKAVIFRPDRKEKEIS